MDMNMVNPDRIEIATTLAMCIGAIGGALFLAAGIACLFNKVFGSRPMATRLPRGERRDG